MSCSASLVAVESSDKCRGLGDCVCGCWRRIGVGIQAVLADGVIAGYPVERVKVKVLDSKAYPVDFRDLTFQIARRVAFRAESRKAKPVQLDPIMDVKITAPGPVTGDIMTDLAYEFILRLPNRLRYLNR